MSLSKINKLAELTAAIDMEVPARKRLAMLFDNDSFVELDAFLMADDKASVVAGYGLVEGGVVYAYSQDITVNSGAISASHAKKIEKVYELAAKTGCPVVCIYDSNGAKLDEANIMLEGYSKALKFANNLSGVVPQIALVLGTCAGISAMQAVSADFVIMSKKAELFLNAPFVTGAKGDADSAAKAGACALVCDDDASAIEQARKIITLLPQNNIASAPLFDFTVSTVALDPDACPKLVVEAIADGNSLVELNCEYSSAVFTYLGTVAGVTTAFVATSFLNALDLNACDKATRFVKLCDAFNIPIVTFVNTNGFEVSGDIRLIREAARLANAYAEATTVKISVITGKAFGAAYIALGSKNANSDVTIAWPQAQISALAPASAVEFLWADKFVGTKNLEETRATLVSEYIDTVASPFEAAKGGHIECVIDPQNTRATLVNMLDMLSGKREVNLPKKHTTL